MPAPVQVELNNYEELLELWELVGKPSTCVSTEDALRDIGDFLLDESCQCQLSQIRCDSFEVAAFAGRLVQVDYEYAWLSAALVSMVCLLVVTMTSLILGSCLLMEKRDGMCRKRLSMLSLRGRT